MLQLINPVSICLEINPRITKDQSHSVCIYVCVCMYVFKCIYICVDKYINTYTHTHRRNGRQIQFKQKHMTND